MAYGIKYQITFPDQDGNNIRLDLLEDAYVGSIITLDGVALSHSYIPSSDDPFEPIYASQLSVSVDITDDLANIPDFTSMDDRKYHVKLWRDYPSYVEFYGWVLSDNVSIGFSTGRRILSFNCVDGLGMLNDVLFPESIATCTNTLKTLLYYIYTSLGEVDYPNNLEIFACCSYYSSGMDDRTTHAYSEPFAQAYMPLTTIKDADYKYISCLQILRNICQSFGCRLQQAKGAWYINAINQMADATGFWYTEYSAVGAVVASGRTTYEVTQQAYTGNTSGMYFQGNNQQKLLLKGFNNIYANIPIEYPNNNFYNWNLKSNAGSSSLVDGWSAPIITGVGVGTAGTCTLVDNVDEEYAYYQFDRGTKSPASVKVLNTCMPTVASGYSLKYSMTFLTNPSGGGVRGYIILTVTSGATTYSWDGDTWVTPVVGYFGVPLNNAADYVNNFSFTTSPLPITGLLSFGYYIDQTTSANASVGNFKLEVLGTYKSEEVRATLNATKQYTKNIELPYGFYPQSNSDIIGIGVLSLLSGVACGDWYRYGKAVEVFTGLPELIMQQYVNNFKKNVININGSLFLNTGFSGASVIKFTDTDTASISVSGKYYLCGNVTRNFVTNEITGTFLEITDVDIAADIESEYYFEGSESSITYIP